MTARPASRWRFWLGWAGISAVAGMLVVAGMIDYCLSPRGRFAWHLAGAAALALLVCLLPALRRMRPFVGKLALALVPAFAAVVVHANVTAVWASKGRIFTEVSQIPPTKVGLVFGTTDRINGRENLYFRYRIDAATRIWNAGKLETLIVSGDNSERYYNEPDKMKRALVKRGIPADRIVCDFAGLRTLDSVVRAKEIFGFQNERAIYLAKAHGMKAYGFAARDVNTQAGLKTKLREVGARVKMWLDVNFLNTRPRHLGDKVVLPE